MIILCGCGAVGSRLAMEMCNLNQEWILIDDDTVNPENIGTSAYYHQHIGQVKAIALAELMWRKGRVVTKPIIRELTRPVRYEGLVLDCFDNPKARILTISKQPTLHLGVDEGEVGSVIWDIHWAPPELDFERGNNLVCTHHLGDLIIRSTVAMGVYSIRQFLNDRVKNSYFLNGCTNIVKLNSVN